MSSGAEGKRITKAGPFCQPRHDTYPFIDSDKLDLSGKHVFVAGGSKGIGSAIALSYARAGASAIVISARSPLEKLAEEIENAAAEAGRAPPKVLPLTIDVTKRQDVEDAAAKVKAAIGHIDVLILNAGYLEKTLHIVDQEPESWWQTWNVAILGSMLILRSFLPLMTSNPKGGMVVAVSSVAARYVMPGFSGYQASKLALTRLMEHVTAENAAKGVYAFSIHPGAIKTEMTSKVPKELQHVFIDTVQLPADTVVWLTRERREWLAGRWINCNWDMEEFESKRATIEEQDLLKFRLAMDCDDL